MHGIAFLVGAFPDKHKDLFNSLQCFHEIEPKIIKTVYAKISLTAAKINQDPKKWLSDSHVGTVLIACSTLTRQQVSRCESDVRKMYRLRDGAVIALWLSGAQLPESMSDGHTYDIADFVAQAFGLFQKIHFGVQQLRLNARHERKIRRLNYATQFLDACLQGRVASGQTEGTSWPHAAKWLLSGRIQDRHAVCPVKPGLGDQGQSLTAALKKLCDQLLSKAWQETRQTPGGCLSGGNLRPSDSKDTVSKILMPRDDSDYYSSKESAKQRLVWIAPLDLLEQRFRQAQSFQAHTFDVEACGVWALVVSQSSDQISVAPQVSELPGWKRLSKDSPNLVFLLIGADLHRYIHIYNALRNFVLRGEKNQAALGLASSDNADELRMAGPAIDPQDPTGTIVVRGLLGLNIPAIPIDFQVKMQGRYLDYAEKLLRVSFSEFQRKCILGIHKKPITHWSFIAGAGKTKMLVAVALIHTWLRSDRLVCLCAGTNAIAAELEETVCQAMDLVMSTNYDVVFWGVQKGVQKSLQHISCV